jgi:succinyl-CoA synthetase beta subunit
VKLLEYKAKELFEKFGVPTMKGVVIDNPDNIGETIAAAKLAYPVVLKAQVQTGGRGKAGGIRFAEDAGEAQQIAQTLLFSEMKGLRVNQLLAVEKTDPQTEWYLSIMLDRLTKSPFIIFSAVGGVDIEETARSHPDRIVKIPVNPVLGIEDYIVRYIVGKAGIDPVHFAPLKEVLARLYRLFMEYDCLLAEINPLALDKNGHIVALDGKVDIDDSALYRLTDITAFAESLPMEPLVWEAKQLNFLYISIDPDGDVAVMSNGSGMLMSCIDLIFQRGMKVGAALDLGGGATAERIKEAVRIVMSDPRIQMLFINIFGGITRCDEVAGGVKLALAEMTESKPIVLRIEGTNKKEGEAIIRSIRDGVVSVESIPEGVEALYRRG